MSQSPFNNLEYGDIQNKEGKHLLRVSYGDSQGIPVRILIEPNPTGESKLLSVHWGDKLVDPLPTDNIAVLQVESQLREQQKNVAELEGIKFCSLWTFSQNFNLLTGNQTERKLVRTQNMSDKKYIFGRLWYTDPKQGQVIVYWIKHFEKGKDKPFAWLAAESGKYVNIREEHKRMVDRLFSLIEAHDSKVKSQPNNIT